MGSMRHAVGWLTPSASASRTEETPLSDCRMSHAPVSQMRSDSSGLRRERYPLSRGWKTCVWPLHGSGMKPSASQNVEASEVPALTVTCHPKGRDLSSRERASLRPMPRRRNDART